MTENVTPLDMLPQRLKAARLDMGLSLEAASKLSGVSRSMLSQIERGESSPTIATLWNLTRALQVDFAGLLGEEDRSGIEVLRATEAPLINRGEGCNIRILSPPEDVGSHEVYDLRFDANARLRSDPHGPGTRELLTVLRGEVRVTSGETTETLGPGDSARYRADVPHEITGGEDRARVILIVSGG